MNNCRDNTVVAKVTKKEVTRKGTPGLLPLQAGGGGGRGGAQIAWLLKYLPCKCEGFRTQVLKIKLLLKAAGELWWT